MANRFNRLVLLAILVLLAVIAARPYLSEQLFSATSSRGSKTAVSVEVADIGKDR